MSKVIKSNALREQPDLLDAEAIAAIFAARFDLVGSEPGGEPGGSARPCALDGADILRGLGLAQGAEGGPCEAVGSGAGLAEAGCEENAGRRASELIERAREQAQSIRLQARADGYAEGYAEGLQRGRKEARQEAAGVLEAAGNLARCVAQRERTIMEQAEQDIVELALAAAEKIVRKRVSEDSEIAGAVVREAIARVSGARQVRVRVSPMEFEAVRSRRDEFANLLDASTALEVVEDPRISPGGCVVETPTGNVDARVEEQMGSVRRALQDGIDQPGQVGQPGQRPGQQPGQQPGRRG